MKPRIAVTGSSGHLGGLVARGLADAGIPIRLLSRSLERTPDLPGTVACRCSYANDAAAAEALEGVDLLFMVSAAEAADRLEQHRAFVDAAAAAGVKHLVYTSFYGAAPQATFTLARDHWATEQHIQASGMTFTFLRDNFYLDSLPELVGADGVIRGPADEGRVAGVSRADIARVAIAVLQQPVVHENVTYDLTGPEALTLTQVAQVLTECTGSPVSFHNETVDEAFASRRQWEAPQWEYDAWVSTYTAIAAGEMQQVTDAVERITGLPPLSLREFLTGNERDPAATHPG